MKLIPCIVLLLLTLWETSQIAGHPSCSSPGYFVNEHDCSKFYRCTDHSTEEGHNLVRYDFDCPHETVFDQSVDVCVFPGHGGCLGGWSPPSKGWSPPAKGWSPPAKGWSPPSKGWAPPAKGWAPPPKGWAPPAKGWAPPSKGWAPPPPTKGWAPPSKGWAPPSKGWVPPPPTKGWAPPSKGWAPPSKGWSPPLKGWSPPSKEWSPPSGWDSGEVVLSEGSNQLSYRPGSSYIIIYDEEGKDQRSTEEFKK